MNATTGTFPLTFEQYLLDNNKSMSMDSINVDSWRVLFEREQFTNANAPKVIPPCPAWCIQPAGHEYDSADGAGADLVFERQQTSPTRARLCRP